MRYVDGFLIPVPKKKIAEYVRISKLAGKVWRDHGALEYVECAGDDMLIKNVALFPRAARMKSGETVVFSWIVYKSKAHRDRVNKNVMKDPRLKAMMDPAAMPFDMTRMVYGGFKVLVDIRK